jgi:HEAT repeat protein
MPTNRLRPISEDDVAPPCEVLTVDASPRRRAAAARALGTLPRSISLAALRAAATNPTNEPFVRRECATALTYFRGLEAIDALVALLVNDEDADLRHAVTGYLASRADLVADLSPAFKSAAGSVARDRLIQAFAAWGERSANAARIREVLLTKDEHSHVRGAAAAALRRIKSYDPSTVRTLLKVINDDDRGVRTQSVHELGAILVAGDAAGNATILAEDLKKALVAALVERLVTDPEPAVRAGAAEALSRIDDGEGKVNERFAAAKTHGIRRGDLRGELAISVLTESRRGSLRRP